MKKEFYSISDLAQQLDVSPSTIRFYEDRGLILPRRSSGNQRKYTKQDRGRLKLILRGKRFGASLDQIAEMIGFADTAVSEPQQIEKSLYYLNQKLEEIKEKRKELNLFEKDLNALKKKLISREGELK